MISDCLKYLYYCRLKEIVQKKRRKKNRNFVEIQKRKEEDASELQHLLFQTDL